MKELKKRLGLQGLPRPSRRAGFTLIEIIIVFALIGILGAAMIGGNFLPTLLRSRDTKRKADLGAVAKALEAYVNDFGVYPASSGGQILGCGASYDTVCSWGEMFGSSSGTVYMSKLPKDSKDPARKYVYVAGAGRSKWQLYAALENNKDPVLDSDGDGVADVTYTQYLQSCGETCNYGISSSNATVDENMGP